MSDESYTLRAEQIEALNSLPPGVYLVCSMCRKFSPMCTTIHFIDGEMLCEPCATKNNF